MIWSGWLVTLAFFAVCQLAGKTLEFTFEPIKLPTLRQHLLSFWRRLINSYRILINSGYNTDDGRLFDRRQRSLRFT